MRVVAPGGFQGKGKCVLWGRWRREGGPPAGDMTECAFSPLRMTGMYIAELCWERMVLF